MKNQLYEFTMKVLRRDGCELPEPMRGAYVPCYASAPDYQAALENGVRSVTEMHYVFDDLEGSVREIPVATWGAYVEKVWPDFKDHLPTEAELPSLIEQGATFFGPFMGFQN